MLNKTKTIIPVYTTRGDAEAFLVYPHLFNRLGEWIGWVTAEREVFSVLGNYVGYLSNGPRILRKRASDCRPAQQPPTRPIRVYPPANIPLAPMMSELSFDTVDVLQDEPDLLHTLDAGEFRDDMD